MKFTNSLIAFAIGDALGVPVEFNSRDTMMHNYIVDMEEYGTHYQPIGTWSDDTSMTIATIDSINSNHGIDYNDIMNNFVKWYRNNEYTATDRCFDIGCTCRSAIFNFNGNNALECGINDLNSNGNGSLMRMLPIAFYCYHKHINDNDIYLLVKNMSCLTHSHEISIMGCFIYTQYVIRLLSGYNKIESYDYLKKIDYSMFSKDTKKVYERIIKEDIYKYKIKDIKSSGYVVDTLEAVFWSIINGKNFVSSVLMAVNLGEDTDTIGAITGSIAGIIYDDIPNKWKSNLKKIDYLLEISNEYEKVLMEEN